MNKIIFINVYYKKKYLKYKSKYLELKKKNNIEGGLGGLGIDTLAKSAFNFIKSNPNVASEITSLFSSNLPNLLSGLSDITLVKFGTYLSQSPQYQQLVNNGFITPQNELIIFELLKLEISHLADPSFYPLMFDLIKNIVILSGSVETFNPIIVLSALTELYNILNAMKSKYPRDFILLSTFLRNNKDKIFGLISLRGFGFPGMKLQFDMFMKLIEVSPQ